jgi:predicted Fe-Mo cluster-binding NifX family protein
MKIAIPFFGNRVSNRLDSSENFLIVSLEKGIIKNRKKIRLVHSEPQMMVNILTQLDINMLICGGITEYYVRHFDLSRIEVIPWITGELDGVLDLYLSGKLK